ncbi:hypothetical protein [Herpetosiphon sp. NSE202]|uniref:hypothetical protein n=1 Tax=Herpetosiphon sp. NSE202 TaxID=3351349 RepID=UPI00362D4A7F
MLLATTQSKAVRRWAMVLAVVLGLWPSFALACTQPPAGARGQQNPITTTGRVNEAKVVFEGTVISDGKTNSNYAIRTATIDVHQYFKGIGNKIVTVEGFGGGADCLTSLKVGDQLFFFIDVGPDGQWYANYSYGGPTAAVTPEFVTEILEAVGKPPRQPRDLTPTSAQLTPTENQATLQPQPTPTLEQATLQPQAEQAASNQGSSGLIWWVLLGLGCLAAGLWLRQKYFKAT